MGRTGRRRIGSAQLVRIAGLTLVAAVAVTLVLQVSIAGALQGTRPSLALSWSPLNAEARARLSALILSGDRSPEALARSAALAQDSLRRDTTRVTALRSLAAVADERGEQARALRLMLQAERLSKRDYLTQLWLIQHYGRQADIGAMIAHFDVALRGSFRNRQSLVPLLVGATADPSIVAPLRAKLVTRPPWWRDFVSQLVERAPEPRTTVALTRGLLDPRDPEDRTLIGVLLERLSAEREYALAWQVYTGARPATSSALVRNGGFEAEDGFAPFDWGYVQEADLLAVRERAPSGEGSVVRLVAFNSRAGEPLRQLVQLAPGTYRIGAAVGDVPTTAFDRPALQVRCALRNNQAVYLNVRPATPGTARIQSRFTIPADCPWQWVAVQIAGQGSQPDVSPWIDNIAIQRAF